jgi:hypothetical protein
MKYEVGDTVRIRSREWIDAQEKDKYGDIDKDGICFVPEMLCYAGRIASIMAVFSDGYFRIDIDDNFKWADWMFDPDYDPYRKPLPAKEAIEAMMEGEHLYDSVGNECSLESSVFVKRLARVSPISIFVGLYRDKPVAVDESTI